MAWQLYHDVREFSVSAKDFLTSRAAENTIILTQVGRISRTTPPPDPAAPAAEPGTHPLFGRWSTAGGDVAAAFMHTPPFPVFLSAGPPEAFEALAGDLLDTGWPAPGVNGSERDARAFAAVWCERTGSATRVAMRSRLYRLGTLTPPDPMPSGAPRVAGDADTDLVLAWCEAFAADMGETGAFRPDHIVDNLAQGGYTLWEVDGVPVSMAGVTAAAAGVARVAPVYTPPGQRRHGYGGAVTAAVSGAARGRGADEVVLYTDLANPTSNSVYQRLGYRAVEDRVHLSFVAVDRPVVPGGGD